MKDGKEIPYEEETIQKQLRNVKNKIIDSVRKGSPQQTIRLALFSDIKVPRAILEECYLKNQVDE